MRTTVLCCITLCLGILGLMACGGDTANSNANSNRSLVNTALNTAGNAVNTVANAVSNVTNTNTASKEPDFMKEAAQGGMAEVELGKLAVSKAQNPEVKKYGQMMVTDHTKANDELKALAAKKNYTLPSDIGSNKSTVEKLSSLSGADFDKAYVKDMVEDHETDVAAFQKQADSATDPDIKAFAAKTLPVLKKHLDAIKAIQAKMK